MKYTLPLVLVLAACSDGQVPVDTSSSGVSELPEGCQDGDVLRFDSAAGDWFCEALPAATTPVGESEVDGFVANNGYALTSDLAAVATTGDYADLIDIPPDADGLGELSTTCADGQIPIWDGVGGAWLCMDQAAFLDTQLSESEVDFYVSNNGYALDADLNAALGTLAAVASSGDFADLINVPPDADTLAALSMSCFTGQIAVWDGLGGAWVCTNQIVDTDVVLTEAEVDAFVANNGYATTADLTASLGGLAAVATSGDYADLLNIPADAVLGEAEVDAFVANNGYADAASLATVATSGDYADLANTPAMLGESEVDAFVANNGYALASTLSTVAATGSYSDLLNVPVDAVLTEAEVDAFVANNGYADAASLAAVATSADYSDLINTPAILGESEVDAFVANNGYADAASLAAVANSGDYQDLTNVPVNIRTIVSKATANSYCPVGSKAIHVPHSYRGQTGDQICAADGRSLTTCTAVEFVYVTNANGYGNYDPNNQSCATAVVNPWPWGNEYSVPNTLDGEWGHGNTHVVCCQ